MWQVKLKSGKYFGPKDGSFLDINEPIVRLKVANKEIIDAEAFYLVFHAVAGPGQVRGKVDAIEFGGIKNGNVEGFVITRNGVQNKNYSISNFPYLNVLKLGIKSN